MKKIVTTSILVLILAFGLKAQTITVPEFTKSSIILYAKYPASAGDYEFSFYDGGTALPVIKIKQDKGYSFYTNFMPLIGQILDDLRVKGYKLIDTDGSGQYSEYYYFQKD